MNGLTIMDLRVLVYEYCTRYFIPQPFIRETKMAGRNFVSRFLERKKDPSLRKRQGVALNRICGLNKTDVSLFVCLFFENLDSVLQ